MDNELIDLRDAVRRRPGMYFGGSSVLAALATIEEFLPNIVLDAQAGDVIAVQLHHDGAFSVAGPLGDLTNAPRFWSFIIGADGCLDYRSRDRGWSFLICMLCATVHARIVRVRDRVAETREWRDGHPDLESIASATGDRPGVAVYWQPDPSFFTNAFDADGSPLWLATEYRERLQMQCQDLAALKAGIQVVWQDDVAGTTETFICPNGMADWLHEEFPGTTIHRAVGEFAGIEIDAAWGWNQHDDPRPRIWSFLNGVETTKHGSHVTGALTALGRRDAATRRQQGLPLRSADERRRGLVLVVSAYLENPITNMARSVLFMPEAESAAFRVVYRATAPGGAASVTMP